MTTITHAVARTQTFAPRFTQIAREMIKHEQERGYLWFGMTPSARYIASTYAMYREIEEHPDETLAAASETVPLARLYDRGRTLADILFENRQDHPFLRPFMNEAAAHEYVTTLLEMFETVEDAQKNIYGYRGGIDIPLMYQRVDRWGCKSGPLLMSPIAHDLQFLRTEILTEIRHRKKPTTPAITCDWTHDAQKHYANVTDLVDRADVRFSLDMEDWASLLRFTTRKGASGYANTYITWHPAEKTVTVRMVDKSTYDEFDRTITLPAHFWDDEQGERTVMFASWIWPLLKKCPFMVGPKKAARTPRSYTYPMVHLVQDGPLSPTEFSVGVTGPSLIVMPLFTKE